MEIPAPPNIDYFQAPDNYFWHWAEKGSIIEWQDGRAICYRDDLTGLLQHVTSNGIPSLSVVLLVLSSCRLGFHVKDHFALQGYERRYTGQVGKKDFEDAVKMLEMIEELPLELKSGLHRMHLIDVLFEEVDYVLDASLLKSAVEELNGGRWDQLVEERPTAVTAEQAGWDIYCLAKACRRFPTKAQLELKLKAGLNKLPKPAQDVVMPAAAPDKLMEALSLDPRTAGVARITDRLIPVLHIPLHLLGSGDQSYGGLSDITNRGSYDRLLLSELAYDDLLFTARLVNREALYFKREQPPEPPRHTYRLLIDTTLRMWGTPRAFAVSAALAFTHQACVNGELEAYTLSGSSLEPALLKTREGIIAVLSTLDHALHCGPALQLAMQELPDADQADYILITEAGTIQQAGFHKWLVKAKEKLRFLITVQRDGKINFYACQNGNLHEISHAKLDLDELLFTAVSAPASVSPIPVDGSLPAFFAYKPLPLLLPIKGVSGTQERIFEFLADHFILVNQSQQVIYITREKPFGAYELLGFIEKGTYYWGHPGGTFIYLLVCNRQRQLVKLYEIDFTTFNVKQTDLFKVTGVPYTASFRSGCFFIKGTEELVIYDCINGQTIDNKGEAEIVETVVVKNDNNTKKENHLASIVNNRYKPVKLRIQRFFITEKGLLGLDRHIVTPNGTAILFKLEIKAVPALAEARIKERVVKVKSYSGLHFSSWHWNDGSRALMDSRGFIHLKSSDQNLPEITLVLLIDTELAGWSSNGHVFGSKWFLHEKAWTEVAPGVFYEQYIQPFIDRILSNAVDPSI